MSGVAPSRSECWPPVSELNQFLVNASRLMDELLVWALAGKGKTWEVLTSHWVIRVINWHTSGKAEG